MGSVVYEKEVNRVKVEMTLGEMVFRPVYFVKDGQVVPGTETLGDVIRRLGWHILKQIGPVYTEKLKFKYGDVEVVDDKVRVYFYTDELKVEKDPGPP
jgi:hypothetical protein